MSLITSIIKKQLESEFLNGVSTTHIGQITGIIKKELGLSYITLQVDPFEKCITIEVFDSKGGKLHIKPNDKVKTLLINLANFLNIPGWKIEFEKRSQNG